MSDEGDSPVVATSPTPSDGSEASAAPARKKNSVSPQRADDSASGRGSTPAGQADEEDRAASDGDADAGLFGDESDEEPTTTRRKRALDDAELDSGDDEGRQDRLEEGEEGDVEMQEQRELTTVEIGLGRHAVPRPSDGELYLLRFSQSVGIQPRKFHRKSFRPPHERHHNAPPNAGFSPAQTAATAMRWRRSREDPAQLRSNTRVIRWSDGSLTLQVASNAADQLELPPKVLAPPQLNPRKATPTSLAGAKAQLLGYNARLDSHAYLASIHEETNFVQLTNHVTTALTVQAGMGEDDDALIRLQEQIAAASKGYAKADQASGPGILAVMEDPELAKRKAEVAERDRLRAAKRRETQEQKMRDRQSGVLARSGLRGMLGPELDDGAPRPARAKPRKTRRRGSEYSEDEDDYRRGGRTREDEYDEDDGFVAGSDEELEFVDDDADDLDRNIEAESEADRKRSRPSPKRARGEDDAAGAAAGPKRGRRQVVEDDDEDDE